MATTYTTNYNLGKQENHADKFDMDVITDNADKIDAALAGLQSGIDGKQATLTTAQLAAVNSGVTSADVEQITTNKNNILSLDNIVQGVEYTYINGGYIALSGGVGSTVSLSPIDSNEWAYIIIDNVTVGMVYSITGTGGFGPRLWAFVDDDLKILSVADNQETGTNKLIKAPANTKYLISDVSIASPHKLSTASLLDRLNASTF